LDIPAKLKNLTDEQLEALEIEGRAVLAREDSPEGYKNFYRVVFGTEVPPHAVKWIDSIYKAREDGKGFAIMAFRGSTKTTTVTIGFAAFQIGLYPERANMLIQVSDDKAQKATKAIADIITNNPGWKKIFPHVVPDEPRGWSANGYEVKRDDIDYSTWRGSQSKRKDPTVQGCGYTSGNIIGSHPDGLLIVDDILDEGNTRSQREMEGVRQIIKSTILPCATKETFIMLVFTPWREDDPVMEQVKSGTYLLEKTPVLEYAEDGKHDFRGKKVNLIWNKAYDIKTLEDIRARSADIEFARMYLVDLSKAGDRLFRYQSFPAKEVKYEWVMAGGVDYASVRTHADTSRDFFAMCYMAKLPVGGAVVTGGVLERCTQGEAESYLNKAQEMFQTWRESLVEKDGKGEDFALGVGLRNPKLRLRLIGTGGKSKDQRYRLMSPFLESGMVRISDADTVFLNELRYELDNYAGDKSLPHDDALDALYWAIRAMPDAMNMPLEKEMTLYNTSVKKKNPWLAFGSINK
jgi:hypothetical protein